MTNQTLPNDENNRARKSLKALVNELRSIWLSTPVRNLFNSVRILNTYERYLGSARHYSRIMR